MKRKNISIHFSDYKSEMTDIVTYQPPLGILGAIANTFFIAKQLRQIFEYRTQVLKKRYGTPIALSIE